MNSGFRPRHALMIALLSAATLLWTPLAVSAQSTAAKAPKEPKWTVEVFGAYGFSPAVPGGEASIQFPAGSPFTTEGGFTSRTNPSWFFGDGAVLFNEVAAQFGSQFNIQVPRIVPLDAVLGAAGRKEKSGTGFGGRITRRLTSRLSLELGFERSRAKAALTGAASSAIEASRASFESGFGGLLNTVPQVGLQVTATADMPEEVSVSRTVVTGALNITLVRSGRFGAHVTAGAGRASNSGSPLDARLRGDYQFRFFDQYPIVESDKVTIHYRAGDSAVIGVFGGGFTYDVAARHGLRVDIRVHRGKSGQTTSVEASSSVLPLVPTIALPSATSPSIQFSNTTARPSSLQGTAPSATTFTADGLEVRPQVTVSYFIRF